MTYYQNRHFGTKVTRQNNILYTLITSKSLYFTINSIIYVMSSSRRYKLETMVMKDSDNQEYVFEDTVSSSQLQREAAMINPSSSSAAVDIQWRDIRRSISSAVHVRSHCQLQATHFFGMSAHKYKAPYGFESMTTYTTWWLLYIKEWKKKHTHKI